MGYSSTPGTLGREPGEGDGSLKPADTPPVTGLPNDVEALAGGRKVTKVTRDWGDPPTPTVTMTPIIGGTTLKEAVLRQSRGTLDPRLEGAVFRDAPAGTTAQAQGAVTVMSVAPGSRAAENGLEAGDVVTAVNQRAVFGLGDLEAALSRQPPQVLLTIVHGRSAFYLMAQ